MAASTLTETLAATTAPTTAIGADVNEEDVLTSTLRSCANDPDFSVICAFLQKFSKELGLDVPNFKHLQEWVTNTDEVSPNLRDLHIKLLRKTRKTVHEKSWESALSKFCFTYSAQDAWEVERFGYKKSSLKVKLRIFRELLESQFERNAKFRGKLLTLSADSLRSQPIGRDRLGHSYWLTQDADCNLRIYQEHLDEEIWQVVATNRDELVNLITRLRGNEVVLPSSDIGVIDEDTSSSNSCNAPLEKPPPPEEQDDSQEEEAKVPNLRIKLTPQNGKASCTGVVSKSGVEEGLAKARARHTGKFKEISGSEEDDSGEDVSDYADAVEVKAKATTRSEIARSQSQLKQETTDNNKKVKPLLISQAKIAAGSPTVHYSKKRPLDDVDKSSPTREELNTLKKPRPTLLDSKRPKKLSKYEKAKSEEEDDDEDDDGESDEEGEEEEDDNVDDGEEEDFEADDDDEDDVAEEEGEEEDIDSAAAEEDENEEKDIEEDDYDDDEEHVGEFIEEAPLIVHGAGAGKECEAGNHQVQSAIEDATFLLNFFEDEIEDVTPLSEAIEEHVYYVHGAGCGKDSMVGNTKNDGEASPPAESEPKAKFFFGEPGCLKLSPMKQNPNVEGKNEVDMPQQPQDETKDGLGEWTQTDSKETTDNDKEQHLKEMDETEIVEKNVTNNERKYVKNEIEFNKEIEQEVCESNSKAIEENVLVEQIIKEATKEEENRPKINGNNKQKEQKEEEEVHVNEEKQENTAAEISRNESVKENNENMKEEGSEKNENIEKKQEICKPKSEHVEKEDKNEYAEEKNEDAKENEDVKSKNSDEKKESTETKNKNEIENNTNAEPTEEGTKEKPENVTKIEEIKADFIVKEPSVDANEAENILNDEENNENEPKIETTKNAECDNVTFETEKVEELKVEVEVKFKLIESVKKPISLIETKIRSIIEVKADDLDKEISSMDMPKEPLGIEAIPGISKASLKMEAIPGTSKESLEMKTTVNKPKNSLEIKVLDDHHMELSIIKVSGEKLKETSVIERMAEKSKEISKIKDIAEKPKSIEETPETSSTGKSIMNSITTSTTNSTFTSSTTANGTTNNIATDGTSTSISVPNSTTSNSITTNCSNTTCNTSSTTATLATTAASTATSTSISTPATTPALIATSTPFLTFNPNSVPTSTLTLNIDHARTPTPTLNASPTLTPTLNSAPSTLSFLSTLNPRPAPTTTSLPTHTAIYVPSPILLSTPNPSSVPISTITSIPTSNPQTPIVTHPNLKRRFADFVAPRQSTSESEFECLAERQEEAATLANELDELDIGGKRLKMRPKIPNTELRRKVEAQKVATEETTSSSGEEDTRRRRKIISPKQKFDYESVRSPKAVVSATEQTDQHQQQQEDKEQEIARVEKPKEKQGKVEERILPLTVELKITPAVVPAVAPVVAVAQPLKHKPTLAEIIEKKLKKTPEKPHPPPGGTTAVVDGAETSAATFSPPKKSPITKPLKKNLLTQIRQEESDEETIPRKRIINENIAAAIVDASIIKSSKSPEEVLEVPEEREAEKPMALLVRKTLDRKKLERKTPERKTPERKMPERKSLERKTPDRKIPECKIPERKIPERKTPERKTPERQRKRRSSDDGNKQMATPEPEDNEEGVSGKLKKNNDELEDNDEGVIGKLKKNNDELLREKEEDNLEVGGSKKTESIAAVEMKTIVEKIKVKVEVKKEETPQLAEESQTQPVTGRRSGRRGGAAVMYAELPQPKRTRGGAKAVIKKIEPKEETNVKDKEEELPLKQIIAATKKQDTADTENEDKKIASSSAGKTEKKTKNAEVGKTKIVPDSPNETPKVEPKVDKAATTANTKSPTAETTPGVGRGRGGRKKREVDTTNIIETIDAETPVRQSRRIAQQKIREEAERRKLEEIALRTMKQELKKKKKAEKQADPTVPEPSEHSSSSSEESEVEMTKKKAKKKCPGKDGWSSGSEEQEEPEEEDEEPPHYESDPGSPLFKSDHEFSPESDLEDESQVVPMKRARTARKEDAEEDEDGDEEACQKCGKSDHPEWILLCDNCDKGYHCSCLSPVLFYIPEGDWYCPPCQQEQLIAALERQLKEFDELVERKRLENEEEKRLAAEAARAEEVRLELEKEEKQRKKLIKKHKRRAGEGRCDADDSQSSEQDDGDDNDDENDDEDGEKAKKHRDSADEKGREGKYSKKSKNGEKSDKGKRRRGDGRSRRRAATRGARRRRRQHDNSGSESGSRSGSGSGSKSGSESDSSSSSVTDSDDEPIYKLRKRRQINVSYRLNEFDDLINSALKKEMDEVAGAGNLGRGKDITTIIEADKEEKARQKQLEEGDIDNEYNKDKRSELNTEAEVSATAETGKTEQEKAKESDDDDDEPIKRKVKPSVKKKSRKLTTLDISSEEDDASDEDFKTSSFEDEDEDEDTSLSVSSNSDSSLEVYRRRNKDGRKKQRKAARRVARERRKDRRFVVDESDDDDEEEQRPKSKKKRKEDSDYTETETADDDDEFSELSENVDSADLCDDTTSDDSDGAWCPSKRKKQRKSNPVVARKSPKLKKPQTKKPKRVEYSDDDISESEEEEEDDEDDGVGGSGKGSGKQPRSQPLKPSTAGKGNNKGAGKGKGKGKSNTTKKKKKKPSDDEASLSGSEDSTRRTRGRRYAYLEDFDDDSSDGGIKPGVQRPDTPPEERQKFIQKQEEIKRMLAEKNAEGAKLAATPRLTPLKGAGEKEKRSPAKPGDSLSTVPLSVIRQAKVLDIDYLQRKGEPVNELDNVDGVESEFDDADLPDDFPEDMDEDAIARMVEEDGVFDAAAAARDLPAPDEVLRTPPVTKAKPKEVEKPLTNPSLAALSQMPCASPSGLQEPLRKRLPMPTMHPPLLRHQFPPHMAAGMPPMHMLQRHSGPPTHLLQNALSAPLGQPPNRSFPPQQLAAAAQRMPLPTHALPPHLMPARQALPATQPLLGAAAAAAAAAVGEAAAESEVKPRGRRKKITPLRDPLQKQQAAAAATAAATASSGPPSGGEKGNTTTAVATTTAAVSTAVAAGGVIKTTAAVSIAQPPQLYKPRSGAPESQPSVITRMPHLPQHPTAAGGGVRPRGAPPNNLYAHGGDVARFYGPPQQGLQLGVRPPTNAAVQRHRVPLQMPLHPGMRPTYGPPPPLRGTAIAPPNHGQPPTSTAAGSRSSYAPGTPSEHHAAALSAVYGAPPPARHTAPHLSPYRPLIYGNPNYTHRGAPPPGANLPPRATAGLGPEYGTGARAYPPYGYYPPPPPLTTAHPPSASLPTATSTTHSTSAPSSVIVAAPHATSAASITAAPPAAPTTTHPAPTRAPATKSHSPSPITVPLNSKSLTVEPRKKLTTLEAYTASAIKSPLAIGGESSGSRSSPGMQPDGAEDSSSTPANSSAAATTTVAGGEGQASEFSGLVSYFSSQHDDYNT